MHKPISYPLIFSIVCLFLVGCGSTPSVATPLANQPTSSVVVDISAADNKKELIKGEKTAFYVKLNPPGQEGQVTKVIVHGDEGITCNSSTSDMWTWYCTASQETDAATVFAEITGNITAPIARYPVKVIAPTPTVPPISATNAPTVTTPEATSTAQPTAEPIATSVTATQPPDPTATLTPGPNPPPCSLQSQRPPIPGATIAGLTATIDDPQHCSTDAPESFEASGTYAGDLGGREIWVLVYPSDHKYYPQTPQACDQLPAQILEGNRWTTAVTLGGPPQQYDIVVTVAESSSEASQVFKRWLQTTCNTNTYPGFSPSRLPKGLTELAAITIKKP